MDTTQLNYASDSPKSKGLNPPDLLDAALGYVRQGWRVFPLYGIRADGICACGRADCPNPGKHPYTTNGLSDATTSEPLIRKWWTLWPQANIGGRTGSRVAVLDPDSAEGLAEAIRYGVDPDTIHSISRPGHRHHFYKPPAGVVLQNRNKKQGHWPFEHCDARGEGGYVVLPPSRHVSGSQYTWSEWPDLEQLPEVPAALLAAWKTLPSDPRAAVMVWDESDGAWVEDVEEAEDNSGEGYETARYFLRRYTDEALHGANRNPTGFYLALQLRDAPLTYDAALPFMRRYQTAIETIKPGEKDYNWREAEASLKQAYSHEKRQSSRSKSDQPNQPGATVVTFDWHAHVESAATLRDKELVVKPFLLDTIIPHGFIQLGGRPKSGKSVFAQQLALACASTHGTMLAMLPTHGRVLYLSLEDPDRRIKERIRQLLAEANRLQPSCPMPWPERLDIGYQWPQWPQGGLAHLDSYLDEHPETALIVLDTMTDFRGPVPRGGGYDIDYAFSHALSTWVNQRDVNLLGITHTSKRKPTDDPDSFSLDMIQGTTGITAGADTVLVMARKDGIMTLFRSGRDLDNTDPIKLKQEDGTLAWEREDTEEGLTARQSVLYALRTADRPMRPAAIASFVGISGNAIRVACKRLVDEVPPPIGVRNGAYYLTERGPTNALPATHANTHANANHNDNDNDEEA